MARTPTKVSSSPALLPRKELLPSEIERGIARLQERVDGLQVFDINSVPKGPSPELTALSVAIRDTLDRCFGEGTSAFQSLEGATVLNWRPSFASSNYPQAQHYREGAQKNVARSVALLQEAQRTLREDLTDAMHTSVPAPPGLVEPVRPSNKVFVVHGHDDAVKEGLARFLEKIELEAVILHEQPNQGRTIIEKFEEYAGQVGFAVVLLTPDDLGGSKIDKSQNVRARQNVVFELGYFAGKLGRGRTCLLRKGEVELPSDLL